MNKGTLVAGIVGAAVALVGGFSVANLAAGRGPFSFGKGSVGTARAFSLAQPITVLAMPQMPPASAVTSALLNALGWPGERAPNGYGDSQPLSNPGGTEDADNLVATVYPSPWLANWRKARKFNARPVLVAVIDIKDPTRLKENPLHLSGSTNCVYLYHAKGSGDAAGWSAAVTQPQDPAKPEKGCAEPASTPLSLPVAAVGGSPGDVAPAARFVDALNEGGTIKYDHETLVGVKCGLGWCEIGHSTISAPPSGVIGGTQATIKAWHDEQQLWKKDATGKLVASGIRSSIIPVNNIDDQDASDYETPDANHYIPVAQVFFPPGVDQTTLNTAGYGTTTPTGKTHAWNFHPGINYVGLRHLAEGSGKCVVVKDKETCWRAAIVEVTGAFVSSLRVSGMQVHEGVPQPGSARWFWTPADEVVWIPCSEGCCTVETDN
jgi:hypothetical protein